MKKLSLLFAMLMMVVSGAWAETESVSLPSSATKKLAKIDACAGTNKLPTAAAIATFAANETGMYWSSSNGNNPGDDFTSNLPTGFTYLGRQAYSGEYVGYVYQKSDGIISDLSVSFTTAGECSGTAATFSVWVYNSSTKTATMVANSSSTWAAGEQSFTANNLSVYPSDKIIFFWNAWSGGKSVTISSFESSITYTTATESTINYTLTDPLNNVYTGSYKSVWNGDNTPTPTLTGAYDVTFSNKVFTHDEEAGTYSLTADIAFPFPVSNATTKNKTYIQSKIGSSDWYVNTSGNVVANNTNSITGANHANYEWCIIPSCTDGVFSFKLYNVGAQKYIPASLSTTAGTATAAVEEASAGSFNYTFMSTTCGAGFSTNTTDNKFLTVNTSSSSDQNIWVWGWTSSATHVGSNMSFLTPDDYYLVTVTAPEGVAAPSVTYTLSSTTLSSGDYLKVSGGTTIAKSDLSCSIEGYATYYDISAENQTITVTFAQYPTAGYYRLKNVEGNHYLSNVLSGTIKTTSDKNASSIYNVTTMEGGYALQSYETNEYLQNPWQIGTDEATYKKAWKVAAGNTTGYFTLYYSEGGHYMTGDGSVTWYSDDATDENAQWVFEPVMIETRTTAKDSYGTICLPYDAEATGATILACKGKNGDEKIVFEYATEGATTDEESTTLEAGVPYLYRATADAQTFTTTGTTYAEAGTAGGAFQGSYTEEELGTNGPCILKDGKFYTVANAKSLSSTNIFVGAYRAYVTSWGELNTLAVSAPSARTFTFSLDGGSATGINGIVDATANAKNGKFVENGKVVIVNNGKKYNVAGQIVK